MRAIITFCKPIAFMLTDGVVKIADRVDADVDHLDDFHKSVFDWDHLTITTVHKFISFAGNEHSGNYTLMSPVWVPLHNVACAQEIKS